MTSTRPAPESISCATCRGLVARFVAGGLRTERRAPMAAHLRSCENCQQVYAQSMGSAARLGRTRREKRLREEARVRRETHRQMALSATGSSRPRTRFHQLRLVLLPGLFALLVVQFARLPERGTRVAWERGEVFAAGQWLGPEEHEDVKLGQGTWCRTQQDSVARLESEKTTLRLGSQTAVRIESAQGPPRVRLQAGHLVVQGQATISTMVGVFQTGDDTIGRMAWEEGAFVIECESGAFAYSGPLGSEVVEAGAVRSFSTIR